MMRAVVGALVLMAAWSCGAPAASVTFPEAGSKTITVEIADTAPERERGLMFRASLRPDHGMWFLFSGDAPRVFWMKNVRFPIDIIFIDKDFVIRKIWRGVPPCAADPCEWYRSGVPVRHTLEVSAGFCEDNGVKEQQRVLFRP